MDTVIVYLDDAEYARQILQPLTSTQRTADQAQQQSRHWVLVACAPRMTHRISKWVSHSARESWRAKWADKLFSQICPWMDANDNAQVSTILAKTPLPELIVQLQNQYGANVQLVDARRPKQDNHVSLHQTPAFAAAAVPQQDVAEMPVAAKTTVQPPAVIIKKPSRTWSLPSTLASIGMMMMVMGEA